MLTKEQISELSEKFPSISQEGGGSILYDNVKDALKLLGIDLPGYQLRDVIQKPSGSDSITFGEFCSVYSNLAGQKNSFASSWKVGINSAQGSYKVQGLANHGADEIVHTIRVEEEVAFSNWINSHLSEDSDLKKYLPVNAETHELYQKLDDGLILCKLINLAVPETIDERVINKKNLNTYSKLENLTLSLMSAQAIGCNIVNIDADDLSKGRQHLVLGLLWQIIRIGLFNQIDLVHVPGLFRLLNEGENTDDLRKLSKEDILMRWVNYHLKKAGCNRQLKNFTSDVVDSEIYTHLLQQVAPPDSGVNLSPLKVSGNLQRATAMLQQADKINCREFVTPNDVCNGIYNLNLAFLANLFNKYPNLPELDVEETEQFNDIDGETREEKTYRNWMNSMGVKPFVNWLYGDLQDGLIIFQLYDVIKPGIVNWKNVVTTFRKLQMLMDKISNCNYAVQLGVQLRFSLVGIQGKDLYDGNRTLTLALVWQLMRAYTLTILSQCTNKNDGTLVTDKEIIAWVNEKLASSGKKTSIKSFQDPSISDGTVVIDLIDAISPGTINYDMVKSGGESAKIANANTKVMSSCGSMALRKLLLTPSTWDKTSVVSIHISPIANKGRARIPFYNKHMKVTDPAQQDPDYFEKKAATLPLDNHYLDALELLWKNKVGSEREVMMKGSDNLIGNKGDYGLPQIDVSQPRYEYKHVEELKNAPESVKKIFSVEYGERKDLTKVWKRTMIESVNKHKFDDSSLQSKIAWTTAMIRQWTALVDSMLAKNPKKPTWLTHRLLLMINFRRKLLRLLRQQDEAGFEHVINELKIAYHVPKQPEHVKTRKAWSEHQLKIRIEKEKEKKLDLLHKSFMENRDEKVAIIEKKLNDLDIEEKNIHKRLRELDIVDGRTVANINGVYQANLIEELSETTMHSILFGHYEK
ncbi:Fimbrin [Strongyloides ratti]|uniref:Fimbrin n=1 Tax=Strongyloides ratti TaxID=34506 RepID=A0A090L583_STRRB|nr:Fimbrin [Strongyloides ratti]CEF64966.1 Fimbrin [Strongyloides ratti]